MQCPHCRAHLSWWQEVIAKLFGCGWYCQHEGPPCPKCDGFRIVSCHCGGDLCVCDNNGEKDCPLCYGEGVASTARAEKHLKHQREMHAVMQKVWAEDAAKQKK